MLMNFITNRHPQYLNYEKLHNLLGAVKNDRLDLTET